LLVTKIDDQYNVKISDFGISRNISDEYYQISGSTELPVRWCAPEVLQIRQFSAASDVWSFGIVMWEILNYGKTPYSWLSNKDVTEQIPKGEKLPQPPNCPSKLWNIINTCFELDPLRRPSFANLLKELNRFQEGLRTESEQPIESKPNFQRSEEVIYN